MTVLSRRDLRFTGGAVLLILSAAGLGLGAGCSDSSSRPGGTTGTGGASGGAGGAQNSGGAGGNASGAGGSGGNTGGTGGGNAGSGGNAGTGGAAPDGGADASDGAAGDGDAAGGVLTLPIVRGDLHVLEFGALKFEVKATVGARITSLKLDGDELLTGPEANPRFYGSTLWTSPADDWVTGAFDPPAVVDRDPYMVTVADGVITTTNGNYTTPRGGSKMFSVTKVFRADIANQAIVIDYKITNRGTAPFSMSHWEVTRVFPGGLTFVPTGTASKVDFLPQRMMLMQAQGYTWYDNTTHVAMATPAGESKSGIEAIGGYIAHVAPNAKGDILFIKTFNNVAPTAAPTGHYEVELFCNAAKTYVELEDHSAYVPIAPGATYTQTVRWYVRRLPVGTARTVGSAALIAAVRSVLGI